MDWKQQIQDALDEADTSDGEPRIIGQSAIMFTESSPPWRAKRMRYIAIPGILILFLLFVWWMLGEMLGYTTYSRMQAKCARAHTFATVCMEWEKEGNTLTSGIWQIKPGQSDFEDYVLSYYSDAEGQWFGLVLDGDGQIEYTLNSEVKIPGEYLSHPPVYDEQMKVLDSHFASKRRKAVAVWYTDDSLNTMND